MYFKIKYDFIQQLKRLWENFRDDSIKLSKNAYNEYKEAGYTIPEGLEDKELKEINDFYWKGTNFLNMMENYKFYIDENLYDWDYIFDFNDFIQTKEVLHVKDSFKVSITGTIYRVNLVSRGIKDVEFCSPKSSLTFDELELID